MELPTLAPRSVSSRRSHSSQLHFLLSSTLPPGLQRFLSSQRCSFLVSLVRTILPRFPFVNSSSHLRLTLETQPVLPKLCVPLNPARGPATFEGWYLQLLKLSSFEDSRVVQWQGPYLGFSCFSAFFFLFSRLAFHFLAHCLAHWKCLLNFVWWIMNELMA